MDEDDIKADDDYLSVSGRNGRYGADVISVMDPKLMVLDPALQKVLRIRKRSLANSKSY
jgi:hypothetical protein